MAKILIATEKPFAKIAVDGIKEVAETAGLEVVLLEKYTEKAQLLAAVADVEAMIIRSDKIDNEVFDAAKNLRSLSAPEPVTITWIWRLPPHTGWW